MSSYNQKDTSSSKELTNVNLTCEDQGRIQAHNIVLANSSLNNKTEEVNPGEVKNADSKFEKDKIEDISKIKVKYCLNKIKNLAEAKANASRPINVKRLTTNDTNIRYEFNSGQYLHIKDELKRYKKEDTETSEDGNVTIKVEKNSAVEDREENYPESQIKMLIINNKTKEKTSVVIKLYHTNQSIHLQGGRRMGQITSASLLAECMEGHWRKKHVRKLNQHPGN